MNSRAFALAVAVVAALPFGCGSRSGLGGDGAVAHPNEGGSPSEAGADRPGTTAPCHDSAHYCASGGAVRGVWICSVVSEPATCTDGQWTCPPGKFDTHQCDCFGTTPPGCFCNKGGGWFCPDAGTDVRDGDARGDAGPDAHDGGCSGQFPVNAGFACAVSLGGGDPTICSDQLGLPLCSTSGEWKCPDGTIDPQRCDCFSPAPAGCDVCRKGSRWWCADAGTDAMTDAADSRF